jgi:hypothetical protein
VIQRTRAATAAELARHPERAASHRTTLTPTPERILDHLWALARAICAEIETFRPDLIVGLYHSARAPLKAASTLWQASPPGTFNTAHPAAHASPPPPVPFPPTLRTNLGREKLRRYAALRDTLGAKPFVAWADGPAGVAHFLAWIARQHAWQTQLKHQIAGVLGPGVTPRRILVIDDVIFEGTTWVLALGLLQSLFPTAEARFMAGALDGWRSVLSEDWMAQFHPSLPVALAERSRQEGITNSSRGYRGLVHRLAPGTEDIAPESLAWRPIAPQSSLLQQLRPFMPPEKWLVLPRWITWTIEKHVYWRLDAPPTLPGADPDPPPVARRQLTPAHLILRELWRQRRITPYRAAAVCRLSPVQAAALLEELVAHEITVRQGAVYGLHPGVVECLEKP